jgi:hypothetical protein
MTLNEWDSLINSAKTKMDGVYKKGFIYYAVVNKELVGIIDNNRLVIPFGGFLVDRGNIGNTDKRKLLKSLTADQPRP